MSKCLRCGAGAEWIEGKAPPADCKACDRLMTERDYAEATADTLADLIAALLGIDIGEHSSANCPWTEAIEAAEYEVEKRKATPSGENTRHG